MNYITSKLLFIRLSVYPGYRDSTLKLAAEGHHERWQMRREFLSPQYTSQWRDIPKIQC